MNQKTRIWTSALALAFALGVAACEKKGPLEQAGEEVDEAVDTVKRGEESTESKLDDAGDKARESVEEAADAVK